VPEFNLSRGFYIQEGFKNRNFVSIDLISYNRYLEEKVLRKRPISKEYQLDAISKYRKMSGQSQQHHQSENQADLKWCIFDWIMTVSTRQIIF
jgi:hypothetical protein